MTNNIQSKIPNENLHSESVQTENNKKSSGRSGGLAKCLRIIIPTVVVLLCAVAVFYLVRAEIDSLNGVHGRFVCSMQDKNAYVEFDADGSYTFGEDSASAPLTGKWTMVSDKIQLSENDSGTTHTIYYIDNKYIAFCDDSFLKGNVPDDCLFDAQFTGADGVTYVFEGDGKCYTSEEGRKTELGGYITDGKFLVITNENTTYTYLNCGEGITPVFFTQA